MNLQTLLEYLDLEEPSQFEYFENLADLTEMCIRDRITTCARI